ncbi:hypothetical protein [Amycolatopsis palatopharyngis]|nr:hypothetical protein [Amycolatopsis palatopharyngis]
MLPEIWHQINIPLLVAVLAATAITMGLGLGSWSLDHALGLDLRGMRE